MGPGMGPRQHGMGPHMMDSEEHMRGQWDHMRGPGDHMMRPGEMRGPHDSSEDHMMPFEEMGHMRNNYPMGE